VFSGVQKTPFGTVLSYSILGVRVFGGRRWHEQNMLLAGIRAGVEPLEASFYLVSRWDGGTTRIEHAITECREYRYWSAF
jgi:hypothetical protein